MSKPIPLPPLVNDYVKQSSERLLIQSRLHKALIAEHIAECESCECQEELKGKRERYRSAIKDIVPSYPATFQHGKVTQLSGTTVDDVLNEVQQRSPRSNLLRTFPPIHPPFLPYEPLHYELILQENEGGHRVDWGHYTNSASGEVRVGQGFTKLGDNVGNNENYHVLQGGGFFAGIIERPSVPTAVRVSAVFQQIANRYHIITNEEGVGLPGDSRYHDIWMNSSIILGFRDSLSGALLASGKYFEMGGAYSRGGGNGDRVSNINEGMFFETVPFIFGHDPTGGESRHIYFGVQGEVFAHANDTRFHASANCAIKLIAINYSFV